MNNHQRAIRYVRALLPLLLGAGIFAGAQAAAPISIDIDLSAQKAALLQDGQIVYTSPISSGRRTHQTPTGIFNIVEKDPNHSSSLYGHIIDANGLTIVQDGESEMPVPPGGKFVPAPMKYFLRFNGSVGMHVGYLPGYAASHGCIRLPAGKAALFYDIAQMGTPVRVHGEAPLPPPRTFRAFKPVGSPSGKTEPVVKWFPFLRRKAT